MEVMPELDNHSPAGARATLLMFGGIALMVMGAGLLLTSPAVRRYLAGVNVKGLLQAASPLFQKYLPAKAE